jgi:hypothetical protein
LEVQVGYGDNWSGKERTLSRIAQVVFGLSVIPVGLSHLFYYGQITASLIPSWMPFRMGLAYLTGVG